MFATSAGAGKPPGINSKPPLYVIPLGHTLAETLRFSWRGVPNLGTPFWEKPDARLPKEGEVSLLAGLTWVPRRIWLDDPDSFESVCISCGRRERLIRQTVIAPIGSAKSESRIWRDPHVIYQQARNGDTTPLHAANALDASDAAAGFWAQIIAGLLGSHGHLNAPPHNDTAEIAGLNCTNLWIIGFSTVKNDKYLEAIEYVVSADAAPAALELIERWQNESGSLQKKAHPKDEGKLPRKRQHVEIPPMFDAIRPHVEGNVSEKMKDLLVGDTSEWQRAADEYRPMMEVVAKSLSPGITASAVLRRNQIASVIPNMRPKAEPTKKGSRKKGEDA
jgi:hypothetical protein